MRALFALVLLGALAAPAAAHDCGTYRGWYGRTYAYPDVSRHRGHRVGQRPYWHHPYYARFGYQRPYLYYRQLRYFGYRGYVSPMWGGCGGGGFYYTYYPAYVSVAPVYSRLGVALTLDDPLFSKGGGDADGVPRPRMAPVGSRFLVDAR